MAILAHSDDSVQAYVAHFAAWVLSVRPEQCPHCKGMHTCILWGSYQRWVYTDEDRIRIRIQRVMCVVCGVTDALLPTWLHPFRRYWGLMIQATITLALDRGVWGQALVDVIARYNQPVPATLREWVWSFVLSAQAWLIAWLQRNLTTLDPLADLNLGSPPPHLLNIPNARRRAAFIQGWQALRLAECLYAATRARQPDLIFDARALFAFILVSLGATHRIPRLLWPQAAPQAP
jgi:hypothetical protein